uniref:Uncharacterized protein n=1 Tax=Octopus bimaculoides TaxID=37653 RepID=A0A0L8IHD8_OCTBM
MCLLNKLKTPYEHVIFRFFSDEKNINLDQESNLNRLGHRENYSFFFDLEAALAVAVDNFDNFDVLFVNDLYGAGSVHREHGIMLQMFNPDQGGNIGGTQPAMQSTRTGKRSLKLVPEQTLPECYIGRREYPRFEVVNKLIDDDERVIASECRGIFSGLSFVCTVLLESGECPAGDDTTTIEYYPVISHLITDIRVAQEWLKYSEEASREVGQHFVIITFCHHY